MITPKCFIELDRIFFYFREGNNNTKEQKEQLLESLSEGKGLVQLLGKGTTSTVFRVEGEKGHCALKAIKDKVLYDREILALKNLNHPNVISMRGFTTINRHYCICLEILPFVNLNEYMSNFEHNLLNEKTVFKIFNQLISAFVYIHNKRFSHHDLNSRNILIDPNSETVKIIDFGYAVFVPFDEPKIQHDFGTPLYLPLEVLEGKIHDPRSVDVWGLGIILVEMIQGRHPWKSAQSLSNLIELIGSSFVEFKSTEEVNSQKDLNSKFKTKSHILWNREISGGFVDMVDMMLQVDPGLRCTAGSIVDVLKEIDISIKAS